ncbi:plasmid partition protein ParG [Rhodoplanes sp. SY1]|uniref:plasmid partition protein ParG n=1 Tax=Rhodoplanes sp. SY1 TaxID=3166646 RepID=UPI0038B69197
MNKTVPFKTPGKTSPDDWVQSRAGGSVADREAPAPGPARPEPMKRFTLDVTESLHKRIKAQCAVQGLKMADVLREILEREFPEK